jgi:hypothetical protein
VLARYKTDSFCRMVIALAARARCPRGDLPNIWICFGSRVAVPMWPPPCGRPPCGPPYVSESVGRSTSTSHTVDRMRWRWQAKRMKWWKRLGLRPLTTTWRRERVGIWVRLRRPLPRQRPGFAAWRKRAGKSGKSRRSRREGQAAPRSHPRLFPVPPQLLQGTLPRGCHRGGPAATAPGYTFA